MSDLDEAAGDGDRYETCGTERADGSGLDPERPGDVVRTPATREFGRRGWLLLAMLFVAFVVVPALIYFRPPGVSFTFAYLVLPLVPATVLALVAVWAATR